MGSVAFSCLPSCKAGIPQPVHPTSMGACSVPLSGVLGRPLNWSLCSVTITKCTSSQLTDNPTARGQELRDPVFPQKERKSLVKLTEAVTGAWIGLEGTDCFL